MPHFTNDGHALYYEVHGKGHPVVLVHGGAVSFERNYAMFGWIERLNASGLQVIGLDSRGHGKSAKPREARAYGTTNMAGDVLALLAHLDIERASIVGYSIGGAIALHLAHAHPERVSSAALVAVGDGLLGLPLPRCCRAPNIRPIFRGTCRPTGNSFTTRAATGWPASRPRARAIRPCPSRKPPASRFPCWS